MIPKFMISMVSFLLILSACTPAPTPTPSAIPTTAAPTATINPTPTLDPYGDPDGDSYSTIFEEIWGTDPMKHTSFEDLSTIPGSIYTKMYSSQPFDVEDMNGLLYQVAREIEVDDGGTPQDTGDDTLLFEVVLFPYARFKQGQIETVVDHFPIEHSTYPSEIQPYLETGEISDTSEELETLTLEIVQGAETVEEAINRVLVWDRANLELLEPSKGFLYFSEIITLKSSDMIRDRFIWHCISKSTLLNSQMKALGIPSRIIHSNYVTDETNQQETGLYDHEQNIVYINGNWVRLDFHTGLNYIGDLSDLFAYGYLVITDIHEDPSEPDWRKWIYVADQWDKPYYNPERSWELHKPIEMRINE